MVVVDPDTLVGLSDEEFASILESVLIEERRRDALRIRAECSHDFSFWHPYRNRSFCGFCGSLGDGTYSEPFLGYDAVPRRMPKKEECAGVSQSTEPATLLELTGEWGHLSPAQRERAMARGVACRRCKRRLRPGEHWTDAAGSPAHVECYPEVPRD